MMLGRVVAHVKLRFRDMRHVSAVEMGHEAICSVCRCEHANLMKLLGYSTDGPHRCIVYEFMPNGSLEDRLACRVSRLLASTLALLDNWPNILLKPWFHVKLKLF